MCERSNYAFAKLTQHLATLNLSVMIVYAFERKRIISILFFSSLLSFNLSISLCRSFSYSRPVSAYMYFLDVVTHS